MPHSSPTTSEPQPPRPSRRFGVGALVLVAFVSLAVGLGGALAAGRRGGSASEGAERKIAFYRNPMGTGETSPVPTKDSMGMDYIPVYEDELQGKGRPAEEERPTGERRIAFYRNPMGTGETSPVPMKDSMGMDYIPVYEDELQGKAATAKPVQGLATVDIDPARQQLIGLRTAPVERGPVGGAWRTSGKVAADESRIHHLNLKVGGYITHTHAEYVGQAVRRGEPLFSLYSPDLLAGEEEYLLALRTREQLRRSGATGTDGDDLVAAARRKLELWDIPDAELDRIARTGRPVKDLTFYSPASGVITKRDAIPGMRVAAGSMPIELVDLSRVWVLADVYESELRHVKLGMPATLSLKAYPNRTFTGRVTFIAPELDPRTRTVSVRLEFANPTGELKPEMFGEVTLQGTTRKGLRVPDDSVIDSGTEDVVFVALGDGKFQPREVQLGDSDGEHVEVVKGLSQGERVVTHATFLIDSESRLRASLEAMTAARSARPAEAAAAQPAPSLAGHDAGARAKRQRQD